MGVGLICAVVGLVILFLLLERFLVGPIDSVVRGHERVVTSNLRNTRSTRDSTRGVGRRCRSTLGKTGLRSTTVIRGTHSRTGARCSHVMDRTKDGTKSLLRTTGRGMHVRHRGAVGSLRARVTKLTVTSTRGVIKSGRRGVCSRFLKRMNKASRGASGWRSSLLPGNDGRVYAYPM